MIIFEKKLTPSERARRWVVVPSASRDDLPRNESFQIKVDTKTVKAFIDSNNRLLGLGFRVFDTLDLDHPDATVVLEKTPKEEYVLRKK